MEASVPRAEGAKGRVGGGETAEVQLHGTVGRGVSEVVARVRWEPPRRVLRAGGQVMI